MLAALGAWPLAAQSRNPADSPGPLVPVYAGGDTKVVPAGQAARLDLRDERFLKLSWKGGGSWELPYERIQTLYVSLSRPSAMVELGGISYAFLFGALKGRKSYMSVRYEDANGVPRTCYFYLPPGASEAVDMLAQRSKRNPVFESHESKRAVYGPNLR